MRKLLNYSNLQKLILVYILIIFVFLILNSFISVLINFDYGVNSYSNFENSCNKNIFNDSQKYLFNDEYEFQTIQISFTENLNNIFCVGNFVYSGKEKFIGSNSQPILVTSNYLFYLTTIFNFLIVMLLKKVNNSNNQRLFLLFIFTNSILSYLIYPSFYVFELYLCFVLIKLIDIKFNFKFLEILILLLSVNFYFLNFNYKYFILLFLSLASLLIIKDKLVNKIIFLTLYILSINFYFYLNDLELNIDLSVLNIIIQLVMLLSSSNLKIKFKAVFLIPTLIILLTPLVLTFQLYLNNALVFVYLLIIVSVILLNIISKSFSTVLTYFTIILSYPFINLFYDIKVNWITLGLITLLAFTYFEKLYVLNNALLVFFILFSLTFIPLDKLYENILNITADKPTHNMQYTENEFENVVYILFDGLSTENAKLINEEWNTDLNKTLFSNSFSTAVFTKQSVVDIFSGKLLSEDNGFQNYINETTNSENYLINLFNNSSLNIRTHLYTNEFNYGWTESHSEKFLYKNITNSNNSFFSNIEVNSYIYTRALEHYLIPVNQINFDLIYKKFNVPEANRTLLNLELENKILNYFPLVSINTFKSFEKDFVEFEKQSNQKDFYFIHLTIPHPPYILNENCEVDENLQKEEKINNAVLCGIKLLNQSNIFNNHDDTLFIISGDHALQSPNDYGWDGTKSLEWDYENYVIDKTKAGLIIGSSSLNLDKIYDQSFALPNLYNIIYNFLINETFVIDNSLKPDELYFLWVGGIWTSENPWFEQIPKISNP